MAKVLTLPSWLRTSGALVALIAAFVATYYVVAVILEVTAAQQVAVALLGAVTILLLSAAIYRSAVEHRDDVQGILIATAPWLSYSLLVTTVALYLTNRSAVESINIGLLATTAAWLAIGNFFRSRASVDQAEPRNYAELIDRVTQLQQEFLAFGDDERIKQLSDDKDDQRAARLAHDELEEFVKSLTQDLGLSGNDGPRVGQRWILGSGYTDLWNRVHRAEEAAILLLPMSTLQAVAQDARLRLTGSNLPNARFLLDEVAGKGGVLETLDKANLSGHDVAIQRARLRTVRFALNKYTDQIWDKVLRARNQLSRTMIVTGIVSYAGVALALVAGADKTTVLGSSAFFIVGAVIGLFARLRAEASSTIPLDDYGFANARLVAAPLISGLAAIAGVVLTAKFILPTSDVIAPGSVDDSGKVTTVATMVREPTSLRDIFDLEVDPQGLLVAAIFGFTPGLVLDRLQKLGEQYKSDLQKSSVTDGGEDKKS